MGRPVIVGIVGATGLIGGQVLKILQENADSMNALLQANIRVVGCTNSKKMIVAEHDEGVDPLQWRTALAQGLDVDLKEFGAQLQQTSQRFSQATGNRACGIVVDCTASETAPDAYLSWMQAGLHIVTPNKKFGAGPLQRYKAVQRLSLETGRQYLQEASVGAGLPVLTTLKAMVESGDKVVRVEGILSGTLSYIFNTYKPGMPFSQVVADAKSKGYTEPDPREDLSGMDVARKVAILARTCGLDVTLDSLHVHSLVPAPLAAADVTAEQYMQRLHEFDGEMAALADAADASGEVVRYVGCVDVEQGKASVTLVRYKKDHPFAQLQGTDNMLVFTTTRYNHQPMIVRGPGAGAEVTAAGVIGDIIQAVRCHGNAS